MPQYQQALLPIVKNTNERIFQLATVISIIGIVCIASAVFFLEVGILRTVGVIVGLLMAAAHFILRFFVDQHQTIGVLRLTEFEVLVKLKNAEPVSYAVEDLEGITFNLVDFEGETKGEDLLQDASMMNVRSGAENTIVLLPKDGLSQLIQFKLNSALDKRKASYFLQLLQQRVEA